MMIRDPDMCSRLYQAQTVDVLSPASATMCGRSGVHADWKAVGRLPHTTLHWDGQLHKRRCDGLGFRMV